MKITKDNVDGEYFIECILSDLDIDILNNQKIIVKSLDINHKNLVISVRKQTILEKKDRK